MKPCLTLILIFITFTMVDDIYLKNVTTIRNVKIIE